jgi:hypothetical protein
MVGTGAVGSLTAPRNTLLRQRRYVWAFRSAEAFRGPLMSMPAEQPGARRPSLMVYGLMILIACCLPALLLVNI